MNEKLIKMFGYFIAAFVVLIILVFLISSCAKKNYDYIDYQNEMIDAAKDYYKNNKDKLPKDDEGIKKIALKNLINDNYIKEAKDFLNNDNITCDGNVSVTNNSGYYQYIPHINCKDGKEKYETESIFDVITKETVTKGIGLYEEKGEYIFKGDTVNNYLTLNGRKMRVISIDKDQNIRLIEEDGVKEIIWDKIYNPEYSSETGLNEYTHDSLDSNIRIELNKYFESDKFSDDDRSYIKTQSLCIGKRSEEDVTKDGSTECAKKYDGEKLGLLAVYEYLRASLDPNCSFTTDYNCKNYNWFNDFNDSRKFWTITANSGDSKKVYSISNTVDLKNASNESRMNVVINIDGKIPYYSGTGSKEDPYIVGKKVENE